MLKKPYIKPFIDQDVKSIATKPKKNKNKQSGGGFRETKSICLFTIEAKLVFNIELVDVICLISPTYRRRVQLNVFINIS